MNEEWRPVVEDAHYEVSSLGRVRSLPRSKVRSDGRIAFTPGRVLMFDTTDEGYQYVRLFGNRRRGVHRLVASAFCSGYAEGLQVNHKNGIPGDNRSENLEWVTASENLLHSYRVLGRKVPKEKVGRSGKENWRSVAIVAANPETGEIAARYDSMRQAEKDGFKSSNICLCVNGKRELYRGLKWAAVGGGAA